MSNTTTQRGGIGFCGMLTILFIGLKLGNIVDWSWWWVLAPMWLPLTVVVGIMLAVYGVAIFAATRK